MAVKAQSKPGKSKSKAAAGGRAGSSTSRARSKPKTSRSQAGRKASAAKKTTARASAKKTAAKSTRKATTAKRPAAKPATKARKPKAGAAKSTATKSSVRINGIGNAPAFDKLSQVALTARNLDVSVAFYSNVLGLKLLARFDPPGLAFFKLGGGMRLLISATASEASLYFHVDDLDAAVKDLKKRGVEFLQKPAMIHRDDDGDFGKKGMEEWMAFFHDPSGNLLALVERR